MDSPKPLTNMLKALLQIYIHLINRYMVQAYSQVLFVFLLNASLV